MKGAIDKERHIKPIYGEKVFFIPSIPISPTVIFSGKNIIPKPVIIIAPQSNNCPALS